MYKLKVLLILVIITSNSILADNKSVVIQSANTILDVFEGRTFERHVTPFIIDIARNGHLLPEDIKYKLESFGFDFSGSLVVMKSTMMQHYFDTEHFRIHYDLTGYHAVDNTDFDGNSVPDYIDSMANIFEEVYHHDIIELGYTPPPSDGMEGGSSHYDIKVQSTNAYGWTNYGALIGDNPNSLNITENNAYLSNMIMRNNYIGFPNTELENIQVTAAHEYFHAIQLGYDGDEATWLLESTAVWMEEEHYDDVNDCYQYMIPWFEKPHLSLKYNYGLHPYGSFILFKYIDEHLGGQDIIKRTWEQSRIFDSQESDYSIQAVDLALKSVNHTFKKALNNMAIANCILSSDERAGYYNYEEADAYRNYREESLYDTLSIELGIYESTNFLKGDHFDIESFNLQQYGSQYIKINTANPVRLSLKKPTGDDDPLTDLTLHTIAKTINGNYEVQTGQILNIDPGSNTDWIYAVIVSDGAEGTDYNYKLTFSDGVPNTETNFIVGSPYPNPFNGTATIKLKVITPQNIDLAVYDLLGRKIKTIASEYLTEGNYEFYWNGLNANNEKISSGVYYIKAVSDNRQEWKKITLIK